MTRFLTAFCLALGLAALARASGDTGALLATPNKLDLGGLAPNEAASSIRLGGDKDPYTANRPQWHSLDDAHYCYARRDGVGLRTEGKSVLVGELGLPEQIAYVAVTCGVASASNVGKALALTLTAGSTVSSKPFTVDELGRTRTVIFTFSPKVEADELHLSNAGEAIFEVHRVEWRATVPSIAPDVSFYREVSPGETLFCTVDDCTGGSGDYAVAWAFNGERRAPTDDFRTLVRFVAPSAPGDYPLTLTVQDTLGNRFTQTYEVRVRSFNPARELGVSAVTRTGFSLTWERPLGVLTAEDFAVTVEDAAGGDYSATFRPTWTRQGSAWVSDPIDPAGEAGGGALSDLVVNVAGIGLGDYLEACPESGAWAPLSGAGGIFFGLALAPGEGFRLRTDAAEPPVSVTLRGTRADILWERVVKAMGQRLEAEVTGLPAGREVAVSVRARFRRDDRSLVAGAPLSARVSLLPVPIPKATHGGGAIVFDWAAYGDTLAENPAIRLDFYAETPAEGGSEPGLYLTRAFLTGNAGKGGLKLSAAKAVALTNTTGRDIALDGGNYSLRLTSASTGKHSFWDFSLKDDAGEKTYPPRRPRPRRACPRPRQVHPRRPARGRRNRHLLRPQLRRRRRHRPRPRRPRDPRRRAAHRLQHRRAPGRRDPRVRRHRPHPRLRRRPRLRRALGSALPPGLAPPHRAVHRRQRLPGVRRAPHPPRGRHAPLGRAPHRDRGRRLRAPHPRPLGRARHRGRPAREEAPRLPPHPALI